MVPCMGTVTEPDPPPDGHGPRAAAPGGPDPAGRPGDDGGPDVGYPELHLVAATVDLGGHVPLHPGLTAGVHAAAGLALRLDGQRRQVERVLHPLGRVRRPGEVGVREDRHVGGDGGGHAPRSGSPRAPAASVAGPTRGLRPTHDQLGDEVVVVLARRCRPTRSRRRGARPAPPAGRSSVIVPGRGGEPPTGGVLGVDPHLDGVTGAADVLLGEGQAARRPPRAAASRRGRAR